jgi:hypothetical protein
MHKDFYFQLAACRRIPNASEIAALPAHLQLGKAIDAGLRFRNPISQKNRIS